MIKINVILYIIFVILSFIAGFLGNTFIRVIILILNAIVGVMESNYISFKRTKSKKEQEKVKQKR